MTCFRDFTVSLWEIFGGHLLLLVSLMFYIAWWTIAFWPKRDGKTAGAGFFITVAFFVGVAAIVLISLGINSLSQAGSRILVGYILLGATVFYFILLAITIIAFHRTVTSELLLIIVWAALEGAAIAVLYGSGRFSMGQALMLVTLVVLATGVGIVCYILYYRLDEVSRFWNGLIPLIVDAGVVTVFLAMLALF